MKLFKILLIVVIYILNYNPDVRTQDYIQQHQKILIFDPNGVSEGFQSSFSKLSSHSIFIADTIDENINNFDALFLFIEYPYILSQVEGNSLIDYLNLNKPIYLSTNLYFQNIDTVTFWNHIGINWYAELLIEVHVNYVTGVDAAFTQGVFIDTSFISGGIPYIDGAVVPILDGIDTVSLDLSTTFIPADGSLNVIIDLYRLIHHTEFLEKVIEHFGLSEVPLIQFYPATDTAWIAEGGCVGVEIITHNLVSTTIRDSIVIESGLNSYFFYYDSLGNQIPVERYYFIVIDSMDQNEYELWFHPKSWPPFEPVQILFDSPFYIDQSLFDIQLLVITNNSPIDSLQQLFRAEWGLDVEDDGTLPEEFSLSQNYPNPFNPTTSIQYAISSPQFVILKIYDVLGNGIATLVNEEKPAGSYEVEFNQVPSIRHPASGIYFYQLRTGSFVQTRKMILLK